MDEVRQAKSSRYATELFLEPPEEEFLCSICQDVLDGPIELPCRHTYCRICIQEVEERSGSPTNCPLCRQTYIETDLKTPSFAFQSLLGKLRMTCQNKVCGKVVTLEDYFSHAASCDFATIACPVENCKEQIYKKDLERHKEECVYRKISCPLGCGTTHQQKDLEDHFLLTCDLAFSSCPFNGCPERICRKELEQHKDLCEFRDVSCPHGCGEIIQHKDIEEHYSKSCPKGWRVCEKCERSYLYEERDDHDCIQVLKQEVLSLRVQAQTRNTKDNQSSEADIMTRQISRQNEEQQPITLPSQVKYVSMKICFKTFFKATTKDDKVKADTRDLLCLPGGYLLVSDGNNGCLKLFDHKGKLEKKTTFKPGWCRLADLGQGRIALLNVVTQNLAIFSIPLWSLINEKLFDVGKNYYRITALSSNTLAAVCNKTKGIDILSLTGNVLRSIATTEEVRRCYRSRDESLMCTYAKGILKINTSAAAGAEILKTPLPKADNLVGVVELGDGSLILCDYKKRAIHHLDIKGNLIQNIWTLPKRDKSDGLCYISACDGVIACCSDQRVYVFELVQV